MSTNDENAFVKSDVKIPSKTTGWDLDAWKYIPKVAGSNSESSKGVPVIVMAHGLTANKLMSLAVYAEAFVTMGFGVVVFDYCRWGTSAGTPRHVVYVSEQLDDYRTVIKYCRQQPEFDPQRVILWGTSFSGGHVVALASEKDLNLKAVIAQCPYLGSASRPPLKWGFIKTILTGIYDVLRQSVGLSPKYIPAVAKPGEVGLLTTPGSLEGMNLIVTEAETYPNEVSASSLFELPFYNPSASGARITCPVIVIAGEHDNLCPIQCVTQLQRLSDKVKVVSIPCKHFELYPSTPQSHKQSLDAMKAFLLEHSNPMTHIS